MKNEFSEESLVCSEPRLLYQVMCHAPPPKEKKNPVLHVVVCLLN